MLTGFERSSAVGSEGGMRMPVWITSIFSAGMPDLTSMSRAAPDTAMMRSHVSVYFRRWIRLWRGSNAT